MIAATGKLWKHNRRANCPNGVKQVKYLITILICGDFFNAKACAKRTEKSTLVILFRIQAKLIFR